MKKSKEHFKTKPYILVLDCFLLGGGGGREAGGGLLLFCVCVCVCVCGGGGGGVDVAVVLWGVGERVFVLFCSFMFCF